MSEELISIIVPIYKTEKYLKRCVDSILRQTYKNLEVILVDDGSPDKSANICDEYQKADGRVRVIHKSNGGLSSARNAGLEVAKGEYIGFVDSDDYIENTMYEILIKACKKYQSKMACCGRYDEYENRETQISFVENEDEKWDAETAIKNLFLWNNIDSAAWDKIYARELWSEIKYPVGEISEDVPVTVKLIYLSGSIIHVGVPLYHYCHRDASITTSGYSEKDQAIISHAEDLGSWVSAHCPKVYREYESFYMNQLMYVTGSYQMSSLNTRKKYSNLYRANKKNLKEKKNIFIENPYLKYKDYIKIMLGWNYVYSMLLNLRRGLRG